MRTHCVLRKIYLGTILDIFRTYYVEFVHKYDTSTDLASLMYHHVELMTWSLVVPGCVATIGRDIIAWYILIGMRKLAFFGHLHYIGLVCLFVGL